MVIYTDMSTGYSVMEPGAEDPRGGRFANWAPQPEPGLALQEAIPVRVRQTIVPVLRRDRSRA